MDVLICSLSNEDKRLVETMRVRACNTLSHCAVRSSINFSPHIAKVGSIDMLFVIYVETSPKKQTRD